MAIALVNEEGRGEILKQNSKENHYCYLLHFTHQNYWILAFQEAFEFRSTLRLWRVQNDLRSSKSLENISNLSKVWVSTLLWFLGDLMEH